MKRCAIIIVLLMGIVLVGTSFAAETDETQSVIEPLTKVILKQMSDYLKDANEFTVKADKFYDTVFEDGQKLSNNASVDLSVIRPNRFQVDVKGSDRDRRFFYDGKLLSMMDNDEGYYVTKEVLDTIEKTLDLIAEKFGITAPLSDLLLDDISGRLLENVQSGFYAGLTEIHGVLVHHLAFTQEDIDWQIWIEDGRQPVPRMIVITYKKVEGSPQDRVILTDWNFNPRLADSFFTFLPPEDATKIEFLTEDAIKGRATGEKEVKN